MALTAATRTTSEAIVSMCGTRKTIEKSASNPPMMQPTARRMPLWSVRLSAFECDEDAGDKSGVNSKPIDPAIKDVTEHRRERDLEREPDMGRIRERIRHEQALRFGKMLGRTRLASVEKAG